MSTKKNKDFIRRSWKSWEETFGDPDKMRDLYHKYFHPSAIFHNLATGDLTLEQRMSSMIPIAAALADVKFEIDDLVAEGDKVAARYTLKATHKGALMGIPATGKQIAFKGFEIDKIAGEKILEIWELADIQGMMNQLGIIPGAAPKT
jgi:predicted ester cyclase